MFKKLSNFLFQLPLKENIHLKKTIPKALVLGSLASSNSNLISKNVIENLCKSIIVLSTYPIEVGDKVVIEKYSGVISNYNFWFVTLSRKNSIVYIPTSRIYNSIYEINK